MRMAVVVFTFTTRVTKFIAVMAVAGLILVVIVVLHMGMHQGGACHFTFVTGAGVALHHCKRSLQRKQHHQHNQPEFVHGAQNITP